MIENLKEKIRMHQQDEDNSLELLEEITSTFNEIEILRKEFYGSDANKFAKRLRRSKRNIWMIVLIYTIASVLLASKSLDTIGRDLNLEIIVFVLSFFTWEVVCIFTDDLLMWMTHMKIEDRKIERSILGTKLLILILIFSSTIMIMTWSTL